MTGFVGAQHEFHNAEFVRGWANRFVPTAPRLQLFDMILAEIGKLGKPDAHVLELGTGPGYMARHILERNATISYEALDFSDVFFDIARETIGDLVPRVIFTNADLMDQAWPKRLSRRPDAIISTWALHDLGGQQPVADVYRRCHETLPVGGVLVNGDFIKPDGTAWDYEPGRFPIARHLEFLRQAGFADPKSLAHLEPNIETPTAAENYACLVAWR
ncbi:MAG: class I SAM-dependent methyltransferase [Hyphomicrobiaceae bacterium]|nr:class I SAM-dependent methyltransferase [Hyphomicrobiaceae bacterium]